VFGVSCKLLKHVYDLKNKSNEEIKNEMQNNEQLKRLQYATGLIIPLYSLVFIILFVIAIYYNTKKSEEKNVSL
jgi:heme/copper-type cytochrome/quinol oxidase subunit 2